MRAWFVLLMLITPALAARAEVTPRPGAGDPHVQAVDYDADEVVRLRVALGYQLALELAADERVETVSVGNSSVWQVTANNRGDHVFIKPMQGAAATNLTVITDVRRYAFTLLPAYELEPDLPYTVRFHYPAAPPAAQAPTPSPAASYRFGGDKTLRPATMFDDGSFTFIAWPLDVSLPAVFVIAADGQEALVNGAVRDGYLVVETVAAKFVFRRGAATSTAKRLTVESR